MRATRPTPFVVFITSENVFLFLFLTFYHSLRRLLSHFGQAFIVFPFFLFFFFFPFQSQQRVAGCQITTIIAFRASALGPVLSSLGEGLKEKKVDWPSSLPSMLRVIGTDQRSLSAQLTTQSALKWIPGNHLKTVWAVGSRCPKHTRTELKKKEERKKKMP